MDNYFNKWASSVINRSTYPLKEKYTVKGINKRHLGGHCEYAVIEFIVEPFGYLFVDLSKTYQSLSDEEKGFVDSGIYGFLDVVLVSFSNPIKNIHITLLNFDIHAVDSSAKSFRIAGRLAGQKLLEKLRG